jgi:Zn-dependent oligopeptidase
MAFKWDYEIDDIKIMVENFIKDSSNKSERIIQIKNAREIVKLLKEDMNNYLYTVSLIDFVTYINSNKQIKQVLVDLDNYIYKLNSNKSLYSKIVKVYDHLKKKNIPDMLFVERIIQGYEKVGIKANSSNLYKTIQGLDNKLNDCTTSFKNIIPLFNKSIVLKDNYAKLNGFTNYSNMVNNKNIANNTENINKFLYSILLCVKEKYNSEYLTLVALNSHKPINSSNIIGLIQKMKDQHNLNINVQEYFSRVRTVSYILEIFENIFKIRFIKAVNSKAWKTSINVMNVEHDGKLLGTIYFDFIGNDSNKCFIIPNTNSTVGILIKSYSDNLTIADMVSFFSDLTLIVQYIISAYYSKNNLLNFINNEADFVKIPSLIMEYVFWSPGILQSLSCNIHTGKKLNDTQIKSIIEARDLTIAFELKQQITLSFYDQIIYSSSELVSKINSESKDIYDNIFRKVNTLISPEINIEDGILYPGISTRDMLGGNGLTYTTLWSKVIASNIYFKAENINNLRNIMKTIICSSNGKETVNKLFTDSLSVEGLVKVHNLPISDLYDDETEYQNVYTEK